MNDRLLQNNPQASYNTIAAISYKSVYVYGFIHL